MSVIYIREENFPDNYFFLMDFCGVRFYASEKKDGLLLARERSCYDPEWLALEQENGVIYPKVFKWLNKTEILCLAGQPAAFEKMNNIYFVGLVDNNIDCLNEAFTFNENIRKDFALQAFVDMGIAIEAGKDFLKIFCPDPDYHRDDYLLVKDCCLQNEKNLWYVKENSNLRWNERGNVCKWSNEKKTFGSEAEILEAAYQLVSYNAFPDIREAFFGKLQLALSLAMHEKHIIQEDLPSFLDDGENICFDNGFEDNLDEIFFSRKQEFPRQADFDTEEKESLPKQEIPPQII